MAHPQRERRRLLMDLGTQSGAPEQPGHFQQQWERASTAVARRSGKVFFQEKSTPPLISSASVCPAQYTLTMYFQSSQRNKSNCKGRSGRARRVLAKNPWIPLCELFLDFAYEQVEATRTAQCETFLWPHCNHINIAAPLRGAGKLVCALCKCTLLFACCLQICIGIHFCVFLHVSAVLPWVCVCVCVSLPGSSVLTHLTVISEGIITEGG